MIVLSRMTPGSRMWTPFLLLLFGCVSGQDDTWTNDLSDLLNVTGLREDTTVGTKLGTLGYSISSAVHVIFSTNSTYFNVSEETGDVVLMQQLSYRDNPQFLVAFYARDLTLGFSRTRVVLVNVRPVNHPPQFDVKTYEVSVKEDIPIGTTVYSLIYVTDIDTGPNGTITFICDPTTNQPQVCSTFLISKASVEGKDDRYFGIVTTLQSIAHTNITMYTIHIIAQDGGNPPLSDSATLIVHVESQYDQRPIFINTPINLLVNESTASTVNVGSVQARSGSTAVQMNLTFMITDDTKGWFQLQGQTYDPNTGISSAQIRTNGNINRAAIPTQQYFFTIIAMEILPGQLSVTSETTVQVTIQDTNSAAPTFERPSYTTNMMEGLGIGAIVPGLGMVCTDRDLLDNANFDLTITSVSPNPVSDIFLVQPLNGQGSVNVYLIANKPEYLRYDDPTKRKYVIQITAREGKTVEHLSGTAMVTINVLSRNTNPPVFTRVEYLSAFVDDRNVGSLVTDQVQAIDPDSGEAGRITYSIVAGDPTGYFQIDPSSAYVTLANKLTYNMTGPYVVLTIQATDQTNLSSTTILRIQIIDSSHNGPRFNPPTLDVVNVEGQTGLTPPATFVASPLEKDRTISYTFISGNTSIFQLVSTPNANVGDPPTGEIRMIKPVDFNDTPNKTGTFEVTVQALSYGGPTNQYTNYTIRINVQDTNNHAPVCNPNSTYLTLTELNGINNKGMQLTQINCTDDDSINSNNSKIHYLIGGGGKDNFIIDYRSGVIYLASQPNLDIDRNGNQYNITVYAVDEGSPPLTGTAMVYVTVTDSVYRPPAFDPQTYTYYVIENTTLNTIIGNVMARSPDRRARLAYNVPPDSISAMNKDNQPVNTSTDNPGFTTWFRLDPTNGSVIVNAPLSYNTASRVDFRVVANVTNPDNPVLNPIPTATANVTVFILPPVPNTDVVIFQVPINRVVMVTVFDNLPIGTVLFPQMIAYHLASQKQITNFTFSATMPPNTLSYINVDIRTGTITLAKSLTGLGLTLPVNLTYNVIASADPPSVASQNATVIITVVSSSANLPTFPVRNYNFTIYNNVSQSDIVGTIQATVPQATGPTIYSIDGTNDFYIDNRTGTIRVNNPDRVKMMAQYGFLGIAAVQGAPSSNRATVVVNVYVIHWYNNYPPQFQPLTFTFYTLDRVPVNSPIGQVYARSTDPYYSSNIAYAVTGGDGKDYFKVDSLTGAVSTNKTLVYRQPPYILTVSATSSGQPTQTSTTTVQIYVANVTSSDSMGFYVPEADNMQYYAYEKRPSEVFLTVHGYSNRAGYNITYSLYMPGYSGPPMFFVNPLTGEMTTNATLDPLNPNKTVCVVMTDNVSPSINISRCILITIVSDKAPSFDLCVGMNASISASVQERKDIGSYVTTIKACSQDKPPNNTDMIYTITDGNDPKSCYDGKSPFKIDPVSGNITTNVLLMWNCTHMVVLNVTVTRKNGSKADTGATKQVIIYIEPTDSSGPSFGDNLNGTCRGVGVSVNDSILDFTPAGTEFIQMYAGDCDAPVFGKHNYSLQTIVFHDTWGNSAATQNVPGSFKIDPITGYVSTNLSDYRLYSYGYFTMTVTATDDKQRSATATLTVYIVREGQRLKFVFSKDPSIVNPISLDYLAGMNNFLRNYYITYNKAIYASGISLMTHVDENAFFYFNMTDMCFQVIQDDKVLSVDQGIPLFPPNSKESFNNLMTTLYTYDNVVPGGPQACYVKTTTHWWSGYWFLWWLLIALALFIFVVALVLNILACCFWPVYTRGYLKNRPYIVLDEPPVPRSPISDFGEWQESSHRFN